MGIQDRDYMQARNRATFTRLVQGAPSRSPRTLTTKVILVIVALAISAAAKYVLERRVRVSFPETGDVHWYVSHEGKPLARLTLEAPARSALNFAVRLDDWVTGAPVALIPVRRGDTSVTLVPLGRYKVVIAKGHQWLGPERLFGMTGDLREAVDPLDFYQRHSEAVGHRIELEVPLIGNMDTRPRLSP